MQPTGGGSTMYRSACPSLSPSPSMLRMKDSLHPSSGSHAQRHSYHATNDMPVEVEERPHRRSSLHYDSSPMKCHDSRHLDSAMSDTKGRSGSPSSPSQTNFHHQKHRNSMPILPSNISSRSPDFSNETRRPLAPSPASASSAHSPVRSSFVATLPTTLERQKDVDLETFRLARACGMTLDPIRVSMPRSARYEASRVDEREAADRRNLSFGSSDMHQSRQKERGSSPHSRPRSLVDCPSRSGNLVIPASSSSPASPTSPSFLRKPGTPTLPNRLPPPFAPPLDPLKQLSCLAGLLKRHQVLFNAHGSLVESGPVTVENLIDVKCLLHEHEVDAQLEDLRGEMERADGGLSFLEKSERAEREKECQGKGAGWRAPMAMVDTSEPGYLVFGQPLSLTRMYAACVSSMAGYQHDLPIVVYACVEELYRTGLTVPGLFRSPPDRIRHSELIELFDNGPAFGRSQSLAKENTADICALLRSYIDRLPRAIWHEALFDPLLKLCVRPSMLHEKALAEASENDEANGGMVTSKNKYSSRRPTSLFSSATPTFGAKRYQHARAASFDDAISFSSSLSSSALSSVDLTEINVTREKPQLAAAKALFRLLPRAQLALLAYLCAFFTQLPLCPHNQLAIEDVARLFAVPLLLGKLNGAVVPITCDAWAKRKEEARSMMVWILRRWTYISEGLFDIEDDPASGDETEDELTSGTSSDDSESVYSLLSNYAWPASDGPRSTAPMGPNEPLEIVSGGQEMDRLNEVKLGPSMLRPNGDMDILAWKSHVEKDIDELRRALLDVRSRLDK